MSLKKLNVGESDQFTVKARNRNNESNIELIKGAKYSIQVDPKGQTWVDGNGIIRNEVTAKGYSKAYLRPFAFLKRYKGANWFALIGAIKDVKSSRFYIGEERPTYTAKANGELICYANDAWARYGNNSGELEVRITRLS